MGRPLRLVPSRVTSKEGASNFGRYFVPGTLVVGSFGELLACSWLRRCRAGPPALAPPGGSSENRPRGGSADDPDRPFSWGRVLLLRGMTIRSGTAPDRRAPASDPARRD